MAIVTTTGGVSLDNNAHSVSVSGGITIKGKDSRILSKQFDDIAPKYEQLGMNLKYTLLSLLNNNGIDFLEIDFRLKSFDSFWEKCIRKDYKNPFTEINDICGIRIIVHNLDDIEKISKIFKKEFKVIEYEDKSLTIGENIFGYNSHHFIISLKNYWLKIPLFKGLQNLKAEIQLRTILMHAWSNISHKYVYKNENNISGEIKRELSLISGKLEEIDHQLKRIKNIADKHPKKQFTNFSARKSLYAPKIEIKKA